MQYITSDATNSLELTALTFQAVGPYVVIHSPYPLTIHGITNHHQLVRSWSKLPLVFAPDANGGELRNGKESANGNRKKDTKNKKNKIQEWKGGWDRDGDGLGLAMGLSVIQSPKFYFFDFLSCPYLQIVIQHIANPKICQWLKLTTNIHLGDESTSIRMS